MAEMASPFVWSSGGERLTPEQVDRKRKVAEALAKQGMDFSPVQHWTQGAARVAQALLGGVEEKRANDAEKANAAESASLLAGLLGGAGGAPAAMPSAAPSSPSASTADPSAAIAAAPADLMPRFAQAEAQYGLPANYLAQTAKIESNFDPNAKNPNSSATGLLQFTAPTARQYGLTNPRDPIASIDAGARLAADNKATLTRALGREPTAGELYLAHQQGGGGASKLLSNPNARAADLVGADAVRLNGGNLNMTAGEFARRWTSKVAANETDMPAPDAMAAEAPVGQPGFAVPPGEPAAPAMTPQNFNAITSGEPPLDPAFMAEGASQPWMGTAMQPQAPMVAQAPAPMPPPRPADLPAPGAVEAIGQMPPQPAPQMMPDLSNSPDGGMRQLQVQAEQARQSQPAAPQEPMSPLSRVTAAFAGGGAQKPSAAPQSPAVAAVTQAVAQNPGDPLVRALTSPYADGATKKIAMAMLLKKMEGNQPKYENIAPGTVRVRQNPDGTVSEVYRAPAKDDKPSDVREYEYARGQGYAGTFENYQRDMKKAGASSVNVGGGSDKQIFDTVEKSADAARSAATGLNAVREARAAVKGGAFLGAGADTKLALQKIGATLGVADPSKIVNTETFRSAIAPAVASLLKSTVGSANISNSDREFAEKAAGGSISLDEGTITRLLDIMERGNVTILEGHQKRMDAIYPDDVANKRERALFGVPMPAAPAAAKPTGQTKSGVKWSVE